MSSVKGPSRTCHYSKGSREGQRHPRACELQDTLLRSGEQRPQLESGGLAPTVVEPCLGALGEFKIEISLRPSYFRAHCESWVNIQEYLHLPHSS